MEEPSATEITSHEITELLLAWRNGQSGALERLTPLVYQELQQLARVYLRSERAGHALQTADLVNEAYLRLIVAEQLPWQNRAHFYGICAQLMRRILVDFARARLSQKRGGAATPLSLDEVLTLDAPQNPDLVALDDALTDLAKLSERQSKVVELRFFGGLSEPEIAEVLQVSPRTVSNDWHLARAWLLRELSRR